MQTHLPTRRRLGAALAVLASAVLASAALASPASADLPPVQPGTTVWTADGTTDSTSGLHNGSAWAPAYTDGPLGGSDQAFDFGWGNWGDPILMDTDVVQFGREPFAVSFNVRTDSAHEMSLLGARNICSNDDIGWFDVRMDGRIGFEVGGDHLAGVESDVWVADGAWHSVTVSRDDTGLSVTVDGQTSRTSTPPSDVHPIAPFGVDNSPCIFADQTWPLLGAIDDIHVGPLAPVDTTAPALAPIADQAVEATGASGATATWTTSATDDTDAAPAVACSPASGSTFALGATPVTCTATDAAGNATERSFTVTVVDTTAPALSLPAPTTLDATGPSGAVATYAATASDVVDGAVPPACAPASGSTFAAGSTTVTCTATDAAGNASTGSFTVTVRGALDQATTLVTLLQGYDNCGCAVQAGQARTSIERGQLTAARGQLGAVRNRVAAAVRSGKITAAQGAAIDRAVAGILASLG